MPNMTPTINTYLSDMLALEQHILQPLQHQMDDEAVENIEPASRVIKEAIRMVDAHIQALEVRLKAIGGHAGSPLKSGVASILGGAAATIGNMRKTEVSKYLRDDYSALCFASISYTMLHTVALGLQDQTTADIAQRHLSDYAGLIMKITPAVPVAVLLELQDEGATIPTSVAAQSTKDSENAWREAGTKVEAFT